MKVTLITTHSPFEENERVKEEVIGLGYDFELLDLSDFNFSVEGGKVKVPQLSDLSTDIIIVRGVFNSQKAISVIVSSLRKKGAKVFDNNFLEHRYSIDKVTDIIKLSLAKVPVPETRYLRDFSKYMAAAEELGYPVVVKSARMGKGTNVFKLESEGALFRFVKESRKEKKEAKGFIMQEFIPYKYDLRCLIIGRDVFTMRRIPREGEFRANFSLGGAVEVFNLDTEGEKLAQKALGAVDMSVGGVDILITEDNKRYILEVNHTAGFVGMEKATGKNIGALYVEHAIENAK